MGVASAFTICMACGPSPFYTPHANVSGMNTVLVFPLRYASTKSTVSKNGCMQLDNHGMLQTQSNFKNDWIGSGHNRRPSMHVEYTPK